MKIQFDPNLDWLVQIIEVKERGEQVIRRDVLAQKHGLNERQGKAIEFLLRHSKLTIQNFESLCPEVNRRSLQRDIKGMLDKNLITAEGATNQLGGNLRHGKPRAYSPIK